METSETNIKSKPTTNQRVRHRTPCGWYEWNPIDIEKLPPSIGFTQIVQVIDGHMWVTGTNETFPLMKYKQYGEFLQRIITINQ